MCFARIGTEATKFLDRVVSHRQSCRSVIDPHEINLIVSVGQLVVGQGKVWIAFHRFVEQANSFKKAFAISRRLRLTLFLYCITEVRLITLRSATLARSVRISSCTPSAK